jgi:AcrR family transcriptional regulator
VTDHPKIEPSNTLETFFSFFVSIVAFVFTFAPQFENPMDEKGLEIIAKTAQLFMRFGIKSMTMDDIARQLGVSKKTLYQYVTDKNDLVVKVMQQVVDHEKERATEMCDQHENAIDMLFALSKEVSQKFGQIHPSINYDLQKYHAEAWDIYQSFKTGFIADCILDNINRGIEQGLYRSNLDAYVISRLYTAKMDLCSDGEMFPPDRYNFMTIHLEMMRYHIRGVANESGLAYLKEKVKQENIQL